ncbi:MAG: NAD-binding protein [Pseudomonadota bacterium]|nr:NAD-binding protein [Pseudomonadota bacterium]
MIGGRVGIVGVGDMGGAMVHQSSGQSWIGSDRMRRAIAGDFEPRAHMTLLEQDTGLALRAAAAARFAGSLAAAAHAVFSRACPAGLAGLDDAASLQFLRSAQTTPAADP